VAVSSCLAADSKIEIEPAICFGNKHPEGPSRQRAQQVGVALHEGPKFLDVAPGHDVREHHAAGRCDSNGLVLRKEPHALRGTEADGDVRQALARERPRHHAKERHLLLLSCEVHELGEQDDAIEPHQALDHLSAASGRR
jgi:hypothetical protein